MGGVTNSARGPHVEMFSPTFTHTEPSKESRNDWPHTHLHACTRSLDSQYGSTGQPPKIQFLQI